LQLIALPAALLIIRRNALNLSGANVFDAIEVAGDIGTAQRVPTDVTLFRRLAVMTSATPRTNRRTEGRQISILAAASLFEQGPVNTVGSPLVVDEAPRTELCYR